MVKSPQAPSALIATTTAAATCTLFCWYNGTMSSETLTHCERNHNSNYRGGDSKACNNGGGGGSDDDSNEMFFDYIPMKQLFKPKRPYPAWDNDWDGREDKQKKRQGRSKSGVTRHIILVRHGQYVETYRDDKKRVLTSLGRQQAEQTGKRLAELIKGHDETFAPCNVRILRSSDMTRAKETADIIARYLPSNNGNVDSLERTKPDPLLNEGIPSKIIPLRPDLDIEDDYQRNHERIEQAFQKYIHRADEQECITTAQMTSNNESNSSSKDQLPQQEQKQQQQNNPKHEFEIIVCHGNVIRYFFCRALQLPPEAWLRLSIFNCSLTYLMIRPDGRTSCRLLGDIGHLKYNQTSFSMNHGFVW